MSDREWALIKPFMPPPKPLGRPRTTILREVVNAILYIATTDDEQNGAGALFTRRLKTERIEVSGSMVVVHARASSAASACPQCGQDLPSPAQQISEATGRPSRSWSRSQDRAVGRRFRCSTFHCRTKVFAEQFGPSITRPHARRTSRLQGLVRHLGLALGGRPAQALADRLLLPVSKDTFLRGARAVSDGAAIEAPRVIGIDDWAWPRGQRYGTLICDLERRRVIDLLPDREPATVEAWLNRHPQIEIVARLRTPR